MSDHSFVSFPQASRNTVCIPIGLVFKHNRCEPDCHDEAFNDELAITCAAVHSPECITQPTTCSPHNVYIPSACAQHLASMIKPAMDRCYGVWEKAQANDSWNRNALCIKSAILDWTVRRHIEAYIPWRQQKLFDYHAHLVRDRIMWVKGNLGVQQPGGSTRELQVWFSLEVDRVIDFFCGPHLYVRTPLDKQWIAVSTVFTNPYPAEQMVLI